MEHYVKFKFLQLQTNQNHSLSNLSEIINQKIDQNLILYLMNRLIKIASQTQTLAFFRDFYGPTQRKRRIYAYYNSKFNKIITDQHLMLIPIDERMATRAHAVFDVVYVKKLNIINLDSHIDRLLKSSESVSIKPPLSFLQTKNVVVEVMSQLIGKLNKEGKSKQQLQKEIFGIRMTISSGYGDFGIASIVIYQLIQDKEPVFYMSVFEPFINYQKQKEGVNQFVVKIVKNPKQLVHTKSVDYVQNALMANESKIRGGYQGIKALENGVLLEAAVANIAFIFDKQFATPRFQTVIEGTTIKKLLKYIEQLKQKGEIQKISFRDITIQEAETKANQMMVIGGDKIVPVLNFNNKKISQKKGRLTQMFQEWYERENQKSIPIELQQQGSQKQ